MTDLKLDPDSLTVMVQKAIIDSITPEQRNKLVTEAIESLLQAPKRDRYGSPTTPPLTQAFERAVETAAYKVVRDMIENDPAVQARIRELVSAPITELCEGNYDGLPEKIGEAVGQWLRDRTTRY